jgi:hypothetical protein
MDRHLLVEDHLRQASAVVAFLPTFLRRHVEEIAAAGGVPRMIEVDGGALPEVEEVILEEDGNVVAAAGEAVMTEDTIGVVAAAVAAVMIEVVVVDDMVEVDSAAAVVAGVGDNLIMSIS